MSRSRTIGVLTAGGDCPGLNACIRAVVRRAGSFGDRVVGIPRGYQGLLAGETLVLDSRSVGNVIHLGGTMLRTARCAEMREARGLERAVRQLDGLRTLGSQLGARAVDVLLERRAGQMVGVQGPTLVTVDLQEAWAHPPAHRQDLFFLSRALAGVWPALDAPAADPTSRRRS